MDRNVFKELLQKLERGESPALTLTAGDDTYIRRFVRGDRLILLGGGHVALDVYRMALMLGFDITVVDDRPEFCNNTRFPMAKVVCDSFDSAIKQLDISDKDYVCILTRGHRWDQMCVEAIFSGVMPYYLGMISSGRRARGMKQTLLESGHPAEKTDRLRSPIGIDIGAVTTAEIALAICAEMIREKRKIQYTPDENELIQTDVNMDMLRFVAGSDDPCALLTVLSSSGSTPVKSGSMMAVDKLGKGYGTVGGGCGEAEAVSRALRIIGSGESTVIDLDMTNEVAADNGMVCGGKMRILITDIN